MSDKTRRWFQIHLSTAVVLMFVAGGIMYLNMIPRSEEYFWSKGYNAFVVVGGDQAFEIRRRTYYGWPQNFMVTCENTSDYGIWGNNRILRVPSSRIIDTSINPPVNDSEYYKVILSTDPGERVARGTTRFYSKSWEGPSALYDCMIAFLIGVGSAVLSEAIIRRREDRKP